MKESIQINKKKNPKLNDILNFLVNGISTEESMHVLKHLNVEIYKDTKYATTTDGRFALWVDVTDFEDLPEGVYALDSTKTSWFLTKDGALNYPNWKQICLSSNEINSKLDHLDLRTCLDKSSQGYLSCLSGRITFDEWDKSFSFAPDILDKVNKGSKKFVWQIVHFPSAGDPVRLNCGIYNVMMMPIMHCIKK